MIKNEIAPGIMVYDNVIPNSSKLHLDIEEGIKSANIEWKRAYVTAPEGDSHINKDSRDTFIIGVPYLVEKENDIFDMKSVFYKSLNNIFFENFSIIENDYKRLYSFETNWHDSYSVLKYSLGQKFINHIDDHIDYPRRLSIVYYINDDYLGGEINFPRFNVSLKPKANQMILFPSTYVYNHSVSPVTEGTRYSVVSWLK